MDRAKGRACYNFGHSSPPGFSQVVVADSWIQVSGQVPMVDGKLPCTGDAETQARQCFANLREALALAGAGLPDIVKLTCFLVDPAAYPGYARVKASLFPKQAPAGTAVIVAGLLAEGALMEVEAVAYRPKGA